MLPNLIYYLPSYYLKSLYLANILMAYESSITNFEEFILETQMQFYVDYATTYLPTYESEYGLLENPSLNINDRRSRIKAKMRSAGTSTKSMIKKVIESWSNATVDIYEDYGNYQIQITFTSIVGIPENINDVYAAVSKIIPAHLGVSYKFRYNLWKDVYPFKWGYIEKYTWGELLSTKNL